jgi:hypothetical protein
MAKTQFNGVGPDLLRKFIERARLLKDTNGKPYLKGPLTLPVAPLEHFFDVEVDPMRDLCYLRGILERRNGDNGSKRFVAFFADARLPAYAYIRAAQPAVIYYSSRYERTIYRKLKARFPDVCSADDIEALFHPTRAIDLYSDVVAKLTEWPTRDHSIKTLAKYLGGEGGMQLTRCRSDPLRPLVRTRRKAPLLGPQQLEQDLNPILGLAGSNVREQALDLVVSDVDGH